jgi:hypothetical protein
LVHVQLLSWLSGCQTGACLVLLMCVCFTAEAALLGFAQKPCMLSHVCYRTCYTCVTWWPITGSLCTSKAGSILFLGLVAQVRVSCVHAWGLGCCSNAGLGFCSSVVRVLRFGAQHPPSVGVIAGRGSETGSILSLCFNKTLREPS